MKRKLTERAIEALRTDKAQEDVFHSPTPSAGLRLTRDGRKTWFVLYRSPILLDAKGQPKARRAYLGEHRSGKLGEPRYLSLEDFTKAYQIFRGQLAAGIDPQDTGGDVQEEDRARCKAKHLPAASVPEWLRSTWPEGYTEGSLSHRLSEYFEAARTGTGIPKLAPRTLRARVSTAKSHVIKRLGAQPAISISASSSEFVGEFGCG